MKRQVGLAFFAFRHYLPVGGSEDPLSPSTRVYSHDVDASECRDGRVHHALRRVGSGHVRGHWHRAAPGSLEGGGRGGAKRGSSRAHVHLSGRVSCCVHPLQEAPSLHSDWLKA
jgi:hypothetical protein